MTRPRHLLRMGSLLAVAALASACAPQPKSLYVWDTFQLQLHEHFKGDGQPVDKQVEAMEQHLQKAAAAQGALPPGFHAHLGLLKLRQGKGDEAIAHFQTEKVRYPESAPYMDSLLQRATRSTNTASK